MLAGAGPTGDWTSFTGTNYTASEYQNGVNAGVAGTPLRNVGGSIYYWTGAKYSGAWVWKLWTPPPVDPDAWKTFVGSAPVSEDWDTGKYYGSIYPIRMVGGVQYYFTGQWTAQGAVWKFHDPAEEAAMLAALPVGENTIINDGSIVIKYTVYPPTMTEAERMQSFVTGNTVPVIDMLKSGTISAADLITTINEGIPIVTAIVLAGAVVAVAPIALSALGVTSAPAAGAAAATEGSTLVAGEFGASAVAGGASATTVATTVAGIAGTAGGVYQTADKLGLLPEPKPEPKPQPAPTQTTPTTVPSGYITPSGTPLTSIPVASSGLSLAGFGGMTGILGTASALLLIFMMAGTKGKHPVNAPARRHR